MQLPGQLKDTSLGDLLGALHRDQASGILELIEPSGRRHQLELRDGQVEHVETDRGGPLLGHLLDLKSLPEVEGNERLGEKLLEAGSITREELKNALRQQALARLEQLFSIERASVRFHAPRPQKDDPTAPRPLRQSEFLAGRARGQTRDGARKYPASRRTSGALQVLGLPEGATREDISHAFRKLAQEHHPDRHPHANSEERVQLFRRFAEISRAYHTLTS